MTGPADSGASNLATTPSVPSVPNRRRPQWMRAAQFTGEVQAYPACFAFVLFPLGVAIVLAIIANNVDQITQSGIAGGQHVAIWFPSSISVMMVASYLTPHVASGMTRRSFIIGNVAAAVGTAFVYAVYLVIAMAVERWIYHRLGWVHNAATANTGEVFSNGITPILVGMFMLICSGTVAGLLVSAGYYRFGWLLGTLFLPVGLSPIAAVAILGTNPETQFTPFGWHVETDIPGPVIGVVAIAAAAALFALIVRRIDIGGVDE